MARSTRNNAQRQSAPKVEQGLRDVAELAVCEEDSIVESGPTLDTLNLGHAGLRTECWPGTPRLATLRLRRPPRRRTPLHRWRPSDGAEARFTPNNSGILAY